MLHGPYMRNNICPFWADNNKSVYFKMKQKMVKAKRYQWNWQKLSKLLSEELIWLLSFVIKINLFPASDAFLSGTLFKVLFMNHKLWLIDSKKPYDSSFSSELFRSEDFVFLFFLKSFFFSDESLSSQHCPCILCWDRLPFFWFLKTLLKY